MSQVRGVISQHRLLLVGIALLLKGPRLVGRGRPGTPSTFGVSDFLRQRARLRVKASLDTHVTWSLPLFRLSMTGIRKMQAATCQVLGGSQTVSVKGTSTEPLAILNKLVSCWVTFGFRLQHSKKGYQQTTSPVWMPPTNLFCARYSM